MTTTPLHDPVRGRWCSSTTRAEPSALRTRRPCTAPPPRATWPSPATASTRPGACRHAPRPGQAGVPTGVDRHLLRSPGAGRGPRRRRAPAAARRAGRPVPRPDAPAPATSPTAPPTAPSRRTSCAPCPPAGSRASRRRPPTRWPSGCGGTGRVPHRRPGPGQRPVALGPVAGPAARPPARASFPGLHRRRTA